MSFWKKKPLELKEIKNEIPLVDQPLQMPGKSNEELLAELNRVAKWRLKTRWAVFGAVSMFLFTISLPHIADQVINSILQSLKIIVGQATKYDIWWFNIAYLMFFKLFTPALVLVAFITIILNSSRMKALVSELARRREKLLIPIIMQLLKVGNGFGWDRNAAFYSQALIQLLPYATRDEFETMPWEGQKFYIECLNHPNDSVREQARKTIIDSGSLKTLDMLKEFRTTNLHFKKNRYGILVWLEATTFAFNHQEMRAYNVESIKDYIRNLEECTAGLKSRFLDERNLSQLLRPSSANSDGSELLRAAQGVGVDEMLELLLRPSYALPGELSATEIAAKYLPKVAEEATNVESVHPVHPLHPV